MTRRSRFVAVLLVALLLFQSFVPLIAQSLSGPVENGTSPEQWADRFGADNGANWNIVDTVSPEMREILAAASDGAWQQAMQNTPCKRAAANIASSVLSDESTWSIVSAFFNALGSAILNIVTLGE